jgi:hypothetical protein
MLRHEIYTNEYYQSNKEIDMSSIFCKYVGLGKWTIGLALSAALAACGGGGDNPAPAPITLAAADTVVPLTSATVASLVPAAGAPPIVATFNSGFSGTNTKPGAGGAPVDLKGVTTLTFTAPATGTAPPPFTITNGGGTAHGTTTFGSCIFTVTDSTVTDLPVGTVLTVNPCTLTVPTNGDPANGIPTTQNSTLLLGSTTSSSIPLAVTIDSSGTVTIGSTPAGTVPTTVLTGGTG